MIKLAETQEGVILPVKVSPKASQDKIVGWEHDELKVRVCAPPAKGEANRAVIRLLAKTLGCPQRDVILLSGDTSRHKRFCISGMSADQLQDHLG